MIKQDVFLSHGYKIQNGWFADICDILWRKDIKTSGYHLQKDNNLSYIFKSECYAMINKYFQRNED